jgi:UDP-glucose 4-epimerase
MIIILQLQRAKNSPKKTDILSDMTAYVLNHKGEEVISERHQKDFKKEYGTEKATIEEALPNISSFTDIDFDDI